MIGLDNILQLFGKKIARIAFYFVLVGTACYFGLVVYTNNNIVDWVRSHYDPPLAVNQDQLWGYQAPPQPHYAERDLNGKMIKVFNGFTFAVPLHIVNKLSRVVYIDKIVIRYDCIKNFSDDDDFRKVVSDFPAYSSGQYHPDGVKNVGNDIEPKMLFTQYQGGFVEGSCPYIVRFRDESEIQEAALVKDFLKKRIPAKYPLKLNPNDEAFLFGEFELELHDSQGRNWRKAGGIVIDDKKLEEKVSEITPIFFGDRMDDGQQDATVTLYTSEGTFRIGIKTTNIFVGDQFWFPKEIVKPEIRQKKQRVKE